MRKRNFKKLFIEEDFPIRKAMRQLGESAERVLFVVKDKKQLLGSLTDGDIRRWVLRGGDLSSTVSKVYNRRPRLVPEDYDIQEVKDLMLKKKIQTIPVINKDNHIQDVLFWDAVFGQGESSSKDKIDYPVIIMAGGKGTRLDPFTKVLPKPLIPIGDKTIIELIMERYLKHRVTHFFLSINFGSRMIKAYFDEVNPRYKITYVEEKKPLGTIGSLKLLKGKIKDSIIVSNCDIIIESDYDEIVEFHKKNDNDITIVGSFRHFTIPYGVCTIKNGGILTDIVEKPEYDFLVNTGMYIMKKSVIDLIPSNKLFNSTDLIKRVKEKGGKVGVFPIHEKAWIDIGQWEEYHRAVQALGF